MTLLVPPFVTKVTGSATRVGVVFAVMSLAAVVAPVVARVADRTGRHRLIYLVSMLAMAGAFVLLAVDAHTWRWSPLFGLIVGVAYAAQATLGQAFIVGAGQPQQTVAAQLTAFNLAYPLGQLLGALVVAVAQLAGASFATTFWVAAAVMLGAALLSWPLMGKPAARFAAAAASPGNVDAAAAGEPRPAPGLNTILLSVFGTFLLVVVLSSVGNNGLQSQLANVMPKVYGFSASQTSLLLGLAGLLNIATIVYAGRRLARDGALSVFTFGTTIRTVGVLAMALLGLAASPVLLLAALAMLVTFQGVPIPRVAAPALAASTAPTSAAVADGYYFAASALGSVIGCLLAGVLADQVDYNAVNWMATAAGGLALAFLLLGLRPRGVKGMQVQG